ncbi:hypothetical protein U0035_21330 [Niabella yanshanensis]|uniref:Lipoprotein n=1 Tax=Niabella yanshanensis TaxID=577386 RepID=A0ABZ0W838_9BACT|nr:hypothetical protein [Niabella yanshanensis]WQD38216.1 hypothetical protein U0035_21330 [Niabella yanshanensis]
MKTVFFVLLVISIKGCETNTVFVCGSQLGKRYHLTDQCRGLSNCNYHIIPITLDSAIQQHKTLCKWER